MADRPIIFSGPMIAALLREAKAPGTGKTQTRRPLRKQPPPECSINYTLGRETWLPVEKRTPLVRHFEAWRGPLYKAKPEIAMCGSFTVPLIYEPGDRLWIRENFVFQQWHQGFVGIDYVCDSGSPFLTYRRPPEGARIVLSTRYEKRQPSIHMPRWASRLTFLVTDVRVQRLNELTDEDALAEGVVWDVDKGWFHVPGVTHPGTAFTVLARTTPREMFAALWDTLHGSGAWLANPYVVAITGRPELRNIDVEVTPR